MKIKQNTHAAAGMVAAAITILIILAAGMFIYYRMAGQISGLPAEANITAGNLNNTTNFIFTLVPIASIILIAGAILIAVTAYGKR